MAYAVFKTGGKQYRVQEGDKLDVEKIDAEVGSEAKFDEVSARQRRQQSTTVGTPNIAGAKVTATVVDQFRGKKGVSPSSSSVARVTTRPRAIAVTSPSWKSPASANHSFTHHFNHPRTMAHKKGQGSVKNGRDSRSKRLGVKKVRRRESCLWQHHHPSAWHQVAPGQQCLHGQGLHHPRTC